ncbi:MAG: threonine-phosphate decarboxylase CobD [Cyanosarcina radialis HA8281-LM2]|jgi:L-threonine-O-3-phosphate decarboxylase|nr:threonine-phosphate decarboxylase CobD [Cyanosarcina radialis HA8281-LM2]
MEGKIDILQRPAHGGNLAWAASLAGCSSAEILDFSASINPLGPPQSAIAAIQSHLAAISSYPDPNYHQLRSALSEIHRLPPEWILPGNGSAELLTWVGWDLAKLEMTCLITPAFGDYWRVLRAFKIDVLECPLDVEREERNKGEGEQRSSPSTTLRARGAEEQRSVLHSRLNTQHSTLSKALNTPHSLKGLLLNNPHNPTGTLFQRETILPYLDEFDLVVIDEAFMDFLPPEQQQSAIAWVQEYPNLVVLRSLTKFYSLPGLRLGYAVAHPDRLRRWQQQRDPWPVNVLAAAAGEAAIADTDFQQQTWNWLEPARSVLFDRLSQLPGLQPHPSAANFLLVRSTLPSSQLQARLLESDRILIRDCLSFPELGDRYFRIAVRSEFENQRLLKALDAIFDR